ncbi:MAG: zinc ribbon domain-containing protein [Methanoregula sp.]|nr:zinc ribbon domain-containing protein [Methanoregula sp.]
MQKFCPKCYSQSFDEKSFFCHKCGTILLEHIPEKNKDIYQSYRIQVSGKESMNKLDDSLFLEKSVSILSVKPIEICAQCGNQIIDKKKNFCNNCGADVREVLSGDVSSIGKHAQLKYVDQIPKIDQNLEVKPIEEQEPERTKGTNLPLNAEVNNWKSIFILAGIVILFFILMLMILFVFP